MFFEGDRIKAVREMILADDEAGRRVALAKLLPMQRSDFEGLFKAMQGHPVTVRLLDPPLHEFVPHFEKEQRELAKDMNVPYEKIAAKVELLAEVNPMLGHRGCRLGNTYPEITEMQTRAIIEAAMNVKKTGIPVHVEIMVPLVGNHKELRYQKNIIDQTAEKVFSERNDRLEYMVGTMIEVPRAAVTAHQIAEVAEFFSFGTNDLTQMTLGFSRDDIAKFLPIYLEKGILKNDPFQILDRNGVGQLIREAVFKGRGTRENLKCGICGEHGGEPSSVEFCHFAGLNYVSCSPFRPNRSVREDFYNHDRQLLFSELLRHRRIVVGIGKSIGPTGSDRVRYRYLLLIIPIDGRVLPRIIIGIARRLIPLDINRFSPILKDNFHIPDIARRRWTVCYCPIHPFALKTFARLYDFVFDYQLTVLACHGERNPVIAVIGPDKVTKTSVVCIVATSRHTIRQRQRCQYTE